MFSRLPTANAHAGLLKQRRQPVSLPENAADTKEAATTAAAQQQQRQRYRKTPSQDRPGQQQQQNQHN